MIIAIRTELRPYATAACRYYFNRVWGMDIGHGLPNFTFSAKLDKTNPSGIHIGDSTAVSFRVLHHDP